MNNARCPDPPEGSGACRRLTLYWLQGVYLPPGHEGKSTACAHNESTPLTLPTMGEWRSHRLVLALTGHATMWMAVLADMGASLIVVANGLRPLRR